MARSPNVSSSIIETPETTDLEGGRLAYILRRHPRSRSLRVTIDPRRGLIVSIPQASRRGWARPEAAVHAFLLDRERWIRRHLAQHERERAAQRARGGLRDGATIRFRGLPHRLAIEAAGPGQRRSKVSREGLARSIRSRFLDPLGLSRTFVQPDERPAPPIAHGYRRRCRVRWSCSRVLSSAKADYIDVTEGGGGYLPALSVVSFLPASGGMASTPSDLARWAGALWGGRVLGQASTATMLTVSSASTTAHDRPEAGYGLGVVRSDPDGQPLWNHGGGLDGFQTFVGYLPQRQVSFAVAVNTSANSLIVGELVQALLVPRQATLARNEMARSSSSSMCRFRQAM